MATSTNTVGLPIAIGIEVTDLALVVTLADGRVVSAPLTWYPRLSHGTKTEQANHRLIGGGIGMHWSELDEDISVENLLAGKRSAEKQASLKAWLSKRAG